MPTLAEFCPECGTPMSPGLRARRASARPVEDLKSNRRNVFIIGAAFLFGIVVGGQGGWFGSGFDFEQENERRPAVIAAQPLFEAFRDDAEEAEERYDDRYLVVTGEYVRTVPDGQGNPDLRLRTSDPLLPLGVDLVQGSHRESEALQPGQIVTVSCERVVRGPEDNWLQNCSIEAIVSGSAAPAGEAPAPAAATPTDATTPAGETPSGEAAAPDDAAPSN